MFLAHYVLTAISGKEEKLLLARIPEHDIPVK
jgi:hypothetical protein